MPAFHQFLSLSFTVMVSCTGAYCDDPYTPWAETTFVEDNYTLIVGFYPPREVTALEVQALMQPLGAEVSIRSVRRGMTMASVTLPAFLRVRVSWRLASSFR